MARSYGFFAQEYFVRVYISQLRVAHDDIRTSGVHVRTLVSAVQVAMLALMLSMQAVLTFIVGVVKRDNMSFALLVGSGRRSASSRRGARGCDSTSRGCDSTSSSLGRENTKCGSTSSTRCASLRGRDDSQEDSRPEDLDDSTRGGAVSTIRKAQSAAKCGWDRPPIASSFSATSSDTTRLWTWNCNASFAMATVRWH
jgi:hypothetical protein